jgi:hypothetical protein
MPVQTQMQVRRGTASSWTSTNPTLAAGELGFETDTGKFKIGTGSSTWTGLPYATGLNAITYLYNATASQTTFSGVDANGLTLAYTVGTEQVFLNGALQVRGSDYTATDGTSIVLTSGALVGDVLNVIAYGATTITDTYTQAQADAKFVQQTTNFFAGKNKIINGDFFVNQRSFTSVTNATQYGFDRWITTSSDGTVVCSAQTFTPGTAPVAGYEAANFVRIQTSGQTTTGANALLRQFIENVRTLAGQTATISFWAKAGSGTPKVAVEIQQSFGTGGSPSSTVSTYIAQVTLSTSWTRYSVTSAIPSISGKTLGTANDSSLRLNLFTSAGSDFNARTGSLGIQTATIDFWGVQVEAGSIATPFQTATGTIAGELAACQRYYIRLGGTVVYDFFGAGPANTNANIDALIPLPTTLRAAPSSLDFSTLAVQSYGGQAITAVSTLGFSNAVAGRNTIPLAITVSGTPLTAGVWYRIFTNNSTSGYLGFSAEL